MSPGNQVAPVGVLTIDAGGVVTEANDRALELFGGRPLAGTALASLLPESESSRIANMLSGARGGRALTATFRLSGAADAAHVEITLVGDQALVSDVTPQVSGRQRREVAEGELRDAKSLLDAVVENTYEAVFVKDREGRYLLINGAAAAVLGLDPEEATGRLDSDLMDAETHAGVRAHDLSVIESGEGTTREQEVLVDGERRTFLSAKAPYRDASGRVIGIVGIARDITARKRAEDEQRLLAETSDLIESALDPEETAQRLAELAVSHFGELCCIDLLEDDGSIRGAAVAAGDGTAARDLREVRSRWPVTPDSPHPVARVLRSGRSEIVPELPDSVLERIAQSDEHLELMRRLRYRSALVVPLRTRGRMLGTISVLHMGVDRTYDMRDVALVEGMAQRASAALDNARLYEQQQSAAVALQRSLLPQFLPDVEGLDLAVRYEPGAAEGEVGGDWYDALAAPGGELVFMIGDVAGRGIGAATIMGQLRNGLRAYALEGEQPASALNRLDRFADQIGASVMATVIYGRLDPRSGHLRYASAGHPPPLLANGDAFFLGGATRGPLGIGLPGEETEHEATLGPASTLLLYTDGLIERRGEDLADGLERLKLCSGGAPRDAGPFCDHLLRTLVGARAIDDTALLALRRRG